MAKPDKTDGEDPPVITETQTAAAPVADEQSIRVRARGSFHKQPDFTGGLVQAGDEFDVPRGRAAELRANELVDFVDKKDEEEANKLDPRPDPIAGTPDGILMRRRGRSPL
jgi:hypothetical protein